MVYPMGTSHHMFSAGEEHLGVVRNAKLMRPSSASSDQNGVCVRVQGSVLGLRVYCEEILKSYCMYFVIAI